MTDKSNDVQVFTGTVQIPGKIEAASVNLGDGHVPFDGTTGRWADDPVVHKPLAPQINREFSDCGPTTIGQAIAEAKQRAEAQTRVRFDFSMALQWLKQGHRVQRAGWNGKGMHIVVTRSGSTVVQTGDQLIHDKRVPLDPFIMMYTVQGAYVPWLASQTDILAEDWQIV